MSFYIDFQYFRHGTEYIIKELGILNSVVGLNHYIFKPPFNKYKLSFKDRKQTEWLKLNYHMLSWEDGYVPYNQLRAVLKEGLKNAKEIYVKGYEKQKWLENQGYNAINIENLNYKYKIKEKNIHGLRCIYHGNKGSGVCSLQNIFCMRKIMINKKQI